MEENLIMSKSSQTVTRNFRESYSKLTEDKLFKKLNFRCNFERFLDGSDWENGHNCQVSNLV